MARQIDYYFSFISPWSYLGNALLHDIARRHGATIAYKPTALLEVFKETGGLPLGQRHPARQRYRWMELQRWKEKRGLPIVFKPAFWPFDAALADSCVIALVQAGIDPVAYITRAYAGVWENNLNLGDATTVNGLLAEAGVRDPDAIIASARGEAVVAAHQANRETALAQGVFGAPSYVVDGEIFWGQDRLDMLDHMLASGRAAYLPL